MSTALIQFALRKAKAASGSSASGPQVKAATITVPYGVKRARITVSDATVTGSNRILVQPAGPLDTDENDPEMDAVSFAAIAGTGGFDVIATAGQRIGGAFRLNYTVG